MTAKEYLNVITSNGMGELTEESVIQAMEEYAKIRVQESYKIRRAAVSTELEKLKRQIDATFTTIL